MSPLGAFRLDHIDLVVRDLDRMCAFYRMLLDTAPDMVEIRSEGLWSQLGGPTPILRGTVAVFWLEAVRLQLHHYPDVALPVEHRARSAPGHSNLSFAVDDIQRAYRDLSALGIAFRAPPSRIDIERAKGIRFAMFDDPEGNTVELVQFPAADGRLPPSPSATTDAA